MDASTTTVTRAELAALQHDLEGPLATFSGFLTELQGAVDALAQLGDDADAQKLAALIDDDFAPCLLCLNDSLLRLRMTVARLAPSGSEKAA